MLFRSGAELDWRAEPPAGCGERQALGRRWRGGGSGGVGATALTAGRKVLGAPWRSVVWGGAVERGGGGAGEGGCAVGYWGVTQRTRLSSGPGKLLASAGCLRVQGGEKPWGRLALPPHPPPGNRAPGHSAGWQRAPGASSARLSCQLPLLDRGVVCLLASNLRQTSLGILGEPGVLLNPVRGRGRYMEALMGQEAELGGMPSNAARFFAA